jgi:hypothetical protein
MWLTLAERQGDARAAAQREELEVTLTPIQLSLARQRIATWKPRKPPQLSNWYDMQTFFNGYDPNGDVAAAWSEF